MVRKLIFLMAAVSVVTVGAAQAPSAPDVAAQRAAMKKLSFLTGKWSGEASLLRGQGRFEELTQTEEAQFKLDGLVLMIEGVGRAKVDGKLALQALGLISFDDGTKTYRMRAFNDGRWLETDVELAADGNGLSWGFTFGEVKTHAVLRLNEKGEWTEYAEFTLGGRPPQKAMTLTVRRVAGP